MNGMKLTIRPSRGSRRVRAARLAIGILLATLLAMGGRLTEPAGSLASPLPPQPRGETAGERYARYMFTLGVTHAAADDIPSRRRPAARYLDALWRDLGLSSWSQPLLTPAETEATGPVGGATGAAPERARKPRGVASLAGIPGRGRLADRLVLVVAWAPGSTGPLGRPADETGAATLAMIASRWEAHDRLHRSYAGRRSLLLVMLDPAADAPRFDEASLLAALDLPAARVDLQVWLESVGSPLERSLSFHAPTMGEDLKRVLIRASLDGPRTNVTRRRAAAPREALPVASPPADASPLKDDSKLLVRVGQSRSALVAARTGDLDGRPDAANALWVERVAWLAARRPSSAPSTDRLAVR